MMAEGFGHLETPGVQTLPVAQLCVDLIAIDSQNLGQLDQPVEAEVGRYVIDYLQSLGFRPQVLELVPGRPNILVEIPGQDQTLPGVIVHGHLDTVPHSFADWQHPERHGKLHDGHIWGRGAVDMKGMLAAMLAVAGTIATTGARPLRRTMLAFFPDEENGGHAGTKWLVKKHPDLFANYGFAVSEVGGFSTAIGGRNVYFVQTAEKAVGWLELRARGTSGHGSQLNPQNAIAVMAQALTRIASHDWPIAVVEPVKSLLAGVAELAGENLDWNDEDSIDRVLAHTGPARRLIEPTLRSTVHATQFHAGESINVVPAEARATLDVRPLPGEVDEVFATIAALAGPEVEITPIMRDIAFSEEFSGPVVEQMQTAIAAHDPEGVVLSYLLAGGTDNKAFATLGIAGYGFVPLQLPANFDFPGMFHAADERLPLPALEFCAAALTDFVLAAPK